jgi:hypothetical protein
MTSGIATAVATRGYESTSFEHWATAWLTSWVLMIPLVLFAAPALHRLTLLLMRDAA